MDVDARRMFDLVEPIGLLPFAVEDPNDELMKLGMRNYWDGYFAARAAPLGRAAAEVVHALFYNFGPGEVARHLPFVWTLTTPEEAFVARDRGCVRALRRALGDDADGPALARTADLLARAATSAPTEGRAMYAALCALPVPEEPVHRLWHAAMLLREHRGDGHIAALVTHGIGGLESHMLHAMSDGMPPKKFGRVHHLPKPLLDDVLGGLQDRGIATDDGRLTDLGRETKARIEALTDELAVPPYTVLIAGELAELVDGLAPVAHALKRREA